MKPRGPMTPMATKRPSPVARAAGPRATAGAGRVSAPQLRSATPSDLPYLVSLATDREVEPFLAPGSGDQAALVAVLERMRTGEEAQGLMVIESRAGQFLGALELSLVSRHSKLCQVRRLMVSPEARGRGVGSEALRLACRQAFQEHGRHRVQAEVYGDNDKSVRLFERVGFVQEGVRRRAYWRRGRWLDGILFGLLADELVTEERH